MKKIKIRIQEIKNLLKEKTNRVIVFNSQGEYNDLADCVEKKEFYFKTHSYFLPNNNVEPLRVIILASLGFMNMPSSVLIN